MNSINTILYDNLIDTELEWLASFQLENGALPMRPFEETNKAKVVPYFSEFTALAFLVRPEKYINNVRRYMDWHFAHLNDRDADYNGIDGTIYDYIVILNEDGSCTEEILKDQQTGNKSYDSTDSYAALFLKLVWEYYLKSDDTDYILNHKKDISRIVKATLSTMKNGLTWAKPDHPVKYLMDNCEVYRGLVSAEKIYSKILIPQISDGIKEIDELNYELNEIRENIDRIISKIENTMWNKRSGYFYSGLFDDEKPVYKRFSWRRFYPDATAQLFPIIMGVIKPEDSKAKELYLKFNKHYCTGKQGYNWDTLDLHNEYIWGAIPFTAALVGDLEKVDRYIHNYVRKYVETGRKFPLYNSDVAMVIFAAEAAKKYVQK